MKKLLALVTIFALNAQAADTCSMYCNPEKSIPCGHACIPKQKLCRTSWTTACSGVRPATAEKFYSSPKHVDQRPDTPTGKQ